MTAKFFGVIRTPVGHSLTDILGELGWLGVQMRDFKILT